jgi:succinate-semialdehyde dehydrogenase/glutarate-semialdehyde dehydrogenase
MSIEIKNPKAWLQEHAPQAMFIDNQWISISLDDKIDIVDPSTEEVVATVPSATQQHIDQALASTAKAQLVWQALSSWRRSAILRSIAEIIRRDVETFAIVMTIEQGKPVEQARGEVLASADQFDWCADEARRVYGRIVQAKNQNDQIYIHRQPIGPVAAFAPWNFPLLLPARKISAALAAGCAVIAMPAAESPLSCLLIAKAGLEAGLPAGVLNMITGDPVLISQRLIDSDVIKKISLTGSLPVGVATMSRAATRIKPVTVELGGHAPVIVLKDADIDQAAKICAIGKFRNAGQVCISANRFFVDEAVAPRFIERFLEHTAQIRL